MSESTPTVGRIVHYVSYGTPKGEFTSQCRAAIVTAVNEDKTLDLAVLNPTGMFFNRSVWGDHTENQGGTWHWPERADAEPVHEHEWANTRTMADGYSTYVCTTCGATWAEAF
jgi:hypothetical protein